MAETGRIDLHTHSFFSDGALLPSEMIRRAATLGFTALAISDHVDASNLEEVLGRLDRLLKEQAGDFPLVVIPGVELTYLPPARIATLARRAKELGAGLVVVHGETILEPVAAGTNRAAVECEDVDILAHPGLITKEDARLAQKNGVALELSSARGHSLANGHVACLARGLGALLVVNTDAHSPSDLMDQATARAVARGAGLSDDEVEAATVQNPRALVARAQKRTARA